MPGMLIARVSTPVAVEVLLDRCGRLGDLGRIVEAFWLEESSPLVRRMILDEAAGKDRGATRWEFNIFVLTLDFDAEEAIIAHQESGDIRDAIAGNAPILVDRVDGSVHITGTARHSARVTLLWVLLTPGVGYPSMGTVRAHSRRSSSASSGSTAPDSPETPRGPTARTRYWPGDSSFTVNSQPGSSGNSTPTPEVSHSDRVPRVPYRRIRDVCDSGRGWLGESACSRLA